MVTGPPVTYCFETLESGLCGFFSDPFKAVLEPFNAVLGDLTLVAFWGILLGILWIRTENLMLVSIVGILVSGTIATVYAPAQSIGLLLVAVSIGITLFQLIRHKIQTFA
jgi:hypothetical protein